MFFRLALLFDCNFYARPTLLPMSMAVMHAKGLMHSCLPACSRTVVSRAEFVLYLCETYDLHNEQIDAFGGANIACYSPCAGAISDATPASTVSSV